MEVVAEASVGEGKVILISDTSIFTNRYYAELDNKEFITSIFEYLTGKSEEHTIILTRAGTYKEISYLSLRQLFGVLGYVSSSETLGIMFLGANILILQIVMMRVKILNLGDIFQYL